MHVIVCICVYMCVYLCVFVRILYTKDSIYSQLNLLCSVHILLVCTAYHNYLLYYSAYFVYKEYVYPEYCANNMRSV